MLASELVSTPKMATANNTVIAAYITLVQSSDV